MFHLLTPSDEGKTLKGWIIHCLLSTRRGCSVNCLFSTEYKNKEIIRILPWEKQLFPIKYIEDITWPRWDIGFSSSVQLDTAHSFMALNRASYVPAADWLPQTKEKNCRYFSRVVIRFFPVVEIPIKQSSLYNNYHFANKTIPLEYFDRILWRLLRWHNVNTSGATPNKGKCTWNKTVCSKNNQEEGGMGGVGKAGPVWFCTQRVIHAQTYASCFAQLDTTFTLFQREKKMDR